MTINQRVFDTAITNKTICSKAIGQLQANGANQCFLVDPDGNLYAETLLAFNKSITKKSEDNGFTWENQSELARVYPSGGPGARIDNVAEGPAVAFYINNPFYYFLYCYSNRMYFWNGTELQYWQGKVSAKYGTFTDDIDNNFFASTGDGDNLIYHAYMDSSQVLKMVGLDLSRDIYNVIQDYASYSGIGSSDMVSGTLAIKSKNDLVHTIGVQTNPLDTLVYIPYTKKQGNGTGSFGAPDLIVSGTLTAGSFKDLAIDVDGSGNIGIVYSTNNPSTAISGFYATSRDGGYSWINIYNPPPAGYSGYIDSATGKLTGCLDIIGGYSGSFLLSSLFMKDGSGSLFVKEVPSKVVDFLTSTDPWIKANSVDGKVIGAKFFKYTNEATPNFGDKSSIRIAYQVGEMNSKYGQDTVKSRVYHERLSNLAYPVDYSGTAFIKDNIDYYASGYIDDKTALYITQMNNVGMTYSFTRYDPLENSEITGKAAYGSPTTFEAIASVDPGSYGFATVARGKADFDDYMERDSRKIFYGPDTYLAREFVLNKGGYLKRTVWTVRIMGNDYELAQIVPRFLNGKIMYYEANLYVIGPSNDPFSKVILPSES